jgi:hypothetical protein
MTRNKSFTPKVIDPRFLPLPLATRPDLGIAGKYGIVLLLGNNA